ncbi:hypothetical protein JKF63_02119 [Porcisia hertigi]|uniref:Chloride channel protein n=1 Tax=Porcisia hertigi TaxID=2761500 RepID=A0A836L1E4_9TRYP|nr:hypothetical protein JKF63_02119 [Porcisia hertigi]
MDVNDAPLSVQMSANTTTAPTSTSAARQRQKLPARLYTPLFSLLNPIEDSTTAADSGDLSTTTTTTTPPHRYGDIASAEAPLLAPHVPSSSSPSSPAEDEQARSGANAPSSSGCCAAMRRLWHDICVGCAREVPPAAEPRRFSALDRSNMARYESVDTYEADSMLYKDHLETRSHEPRWFMWVFVVVLGIATSALLVGVMTCLHVLNSVRYELLGFGLRGFTFEDPQRYPSVVEVSSANSMRHSKQGREGTTSLDVWAMLRGYSVGLYGIASPRWYWSGYLLWISFAFCSSAIASGICYLVPQSVGAGIPEVRAYLNGVAYPTMFSTRVLAAKIIAVIFTVASGVCTGHYGHLMLAGAMLGAQMLKRRHGLRCYNVNFVNCFRNPRDTRIILVIGAAAGIAAAFNVSVAGLLVILELLSAVFPVRFALYVFAACLLSTLFTQVCCSYWVKFNPRDPPQGGLLQREVAVLFRSHLPFGENATMNLIMFLPAFVIGLCSGFCAVGFVRLSWAALYCRRRLEMWLRTKTIRYVLPIIFTLFYVSLHYWVAVAFSNPPASVETTTTDSGESGGGATHTPAVCRPVPYTVHCSRNVTTIGFYGMNGFLCPAESYRDADTRASDDKMLELPQEQTLRVIDAYASLAFSYADSTLQTLLSQRTEDLLPWTVLLTFSLVYFFSSAVYFGVALYGDTMLPSLVLGASIGRCMGTAVHSIAVTFSAEAATWADPGVFALLGAGSFVSATSGLSFGMGAILIECTADFRHLLPLMLAIAVARRVLLQWGRDLHTVYLETRTVPLLNVEPYLQRYSLLDARHVMCCPVVSLTVICTLDDVVRVLRTTTHHGFPVVSLNDGTFKGTVTRAQLELVLWHMIMTDGRPNYCSYDVMQRVEDHVFHNRWVGVDPTQHLQRARRHTGQVSLYPYVDTSAFRVLDTTALPQTYEMFTTLGLRHLVVVNRSNYAVGMITRKDLVGDHLSAVLESLDSQTNDGRAPLSAMLAAALSCLRKPLHPTPAQVAEVVRHSSTQSTTRQSPQQWRRENQDWATALSTPASPDLPPRKVSFAQVARRVSLLRVSSPTLSFTREPP